jgi:hypothetical protein
MAAMAAVEKYDRELEQAHGWSSSSLPKTQEWEGKEEE